MRKFVIIIPRAFVTYGFINYFDRIACRDLLFTRHIEIKEPQSLRETVKVAILDMAKKYTD